MEIGVWRNNRGGPWFLDWFADHRCEPGDALWEYCKDDGQRWAGRQVDLPVLFPDGARLDPSDDELDGAFDESEHHARLLLEIDAITRGRWKGTVDSPRPHPDADVAERLRQVADRAGARSE